MTDPRILSIISFIFALMAAYSLYTGSRQLRDARRAGKPIRWHKNLSLLTGIEYGLLTFVFLLRTANLQGAIAPNMQSLVGWLYLILLIPAALIAGLVIRRVILNMRAGGQANRAAALARTSTQPSIESEQHVISKQEKEAQVQRQRERRKKAAAARRRQAGKA
jgi:hypothetical protein